MTTESPATTHPLFFTTISKSCAPMSPTCFWFLAFAGVWWLLPLMMLVVAEEQQQGGDCSPKECHNVNISDPFWLSSAKIEKPCGSLDFEVICNDTVRRPTLRSSIPFNMGFAIVNVSYEKHSLYSVDLGKLEVLRSADKCHAPFYNTSIKLNRPFRIDAVNLNLIVYNCTEEGGAAAAARRNGELARTNVRCGNEWEVLARAGVPHDASGNYAGYALKGCAAVVVPVPSSSARANASNYKQLFNDGFLLTWDPLIPPPHPNLFPRPRPAVVPSHAWRINVGKSRSGQRGTSTFLLAEDVRPLDHILQ